VTFVLRVDKVWSLPGRPYPVVWGVLETGEISSGDEVEVTEPDGSVAIGTVHGVELHGTVNVGDVRRVGILIKGPAMAVVRHGAVVRGRSDGGRRDEPGAPEPGGHDA